MGWQRGQNRAKPSGFRGAPGTPGGIRFAPFRVKPWVKPVVGIYREIMFFPGFLKGGAKWISSIQRSTVALEGS